MIQWFEEFYISAKWIIHQVIILYHSAIHQFMKIAINPTYLRNLDNRNMPLISAYTDILAYYNTVKGQLILGMQQTLLDPTFSYIPLS